MSLNKVMLIGNVGKDPEVRYLENGNNPAAGAPKVASFPLATTERYRDRNGEVRESTEWHNIVAWRNSADVAEKYIRKGTQIYVEGKLRTRSWTDQSGVKKYTTEVVVDNLQLLGRKADNPGAQGDGAAQGGYGQQAYAPQQPAYAPAQHAYPQAAPAQPAYAPQPAAQPAHPAHPAEAPIDIMGAEGVDDLPF